MRKISSRPWCTCVGVSCPGRSIVQLASETCWLDATEHTFGKTPCPPLCRHSLLVSKMNWGQEDVPWRHQQPKREWQSEPVLGEHVCLCRVNQRARRGRLDEAVK